MSPRHNDISSSALDAYNVWRTANGIPPIATSSRHRRIRSLYLSDAAFEGLQDLARRLTQKDSVSGLVELIGIGEFIPVHKAQFQALLDDTSPTQPTTQPSPQQPLPPLTAASLQPSEDPTSPNYDPTSDIQTRLTMPTSATTTP
jgi:hypothetical protein